MSLARLIALLQGRALFFSCPDRFGDAFEGSAPHPNVIGRQEMVDLAIRDGMTPEQARLVYDHSHIQQSATSWVGVNCWHMNEHESAAMWKLYVDGGEGIAIKSTFARLRDAFLAVERPIFIGAVTYINYETEPIADNNLFAPFMFKRTSFAHEREMRALVWKFPDFHLGDDYATRPMGDGVNVPADVETLIESIRVAPSSPRWFVEVVEAVVRVFGLSFEVAQSSLDSTALW